MIENSASPLPEASAPTDSGRGRDQPGHRRLHRDLPALGQGQPRQHLACGDGIARIRQHFGDLQPHPLGPHLRLLARNDGAGHLDDIGEAGFRRLEHGDRGALRRAGSASSAAARLGQESRQNIPAAIRGASVSERSRARKMVIGISFPVSAPWIPEGRQGGQAPRMSPLLTARLTASASAASTASGTAASSSARAICRAIAGLID